MSEAHEMAATAEEFGFEDEMESLTVAVGWPRILARGVDMLFVYILFTFAVFTVAGFAFGLAGRIDILQQMLGAHWLLKVIVPLLAWSFAESLFLLLAGGTPGKLLLGLRVVREDADASPGFGRALLRSFWMVWRGLFLGIPGLTHFAMFYWTSALQPPYKAPPWDKRGKTRVVEQRKPGKLAVATAVFLVVLGAAWTTYALLYRSFGSL